MSEDIFDEFERLRRKILREFFEDIEMEFDFPSFEDLDELERQGWQVKRISGPGMKGFVARKVSVSGVPPSGIREITGVSNGEVMYDVFDEGAYYQIYVDLPGTKEEEIKVSASNHSILIETPKIRKYIHLDREIDPSSLEKRFKNGVLHIKVLKK